MSESAFVRAIRTTAIARGEAAIVRIGRYDVAIFNLGDSFVAYENSCPHQGGPIGEGLIEGTTVICPWHAWCFDLRTGKMTLGDFASLRKFEVRIANDAVEVSSEPSFDFAEDDRNG